MNASKKINTYNTNRSYWDSKWLQAVKLNNWKILKPCPMLLVRWQKLHIQDLHTIAGYNSCNSGAHRLCKDKHIGDNDKYTGMSESEWEQVLEKHKERLI